jgi:hypothetical protein
MKTMFKNFRDRIALSGITVLMIGIALLIFTFVSAYGFLTQALSIISSEDLAQTFGAALAPLIATSIRIMYLGVMGWVGSLVTIRGVTILAHTPQTSPIVGQEPMEPEQESQPKRRGTEKPQKESKTPKTEKPEAKPSEPEIVVIPPKEVEQQETEFKAD